MDQYRFNDYILEAYPYPIAVKAELLNGSEHSAECIQRLLELADMTIRFLACVALADYSVGRAEKSDVPFLVGRLSSPSTAVWLDVLDAILQTFGEEPSSFVIPELVTTFHAPLSSETDIAKAMLLLSSEPVTQPEVDGHTNSLKHFFALLQRRQQFIMNVARRTNDEETALLLTVLYAAMKNALSILSFLTTVRLAKPYETGGPSGEPALYVFHGNHGQVHGEVDQELASSYVESESLYLATDKLQPKLILHPYILAEDGEIYVLFQNLQDGESAYVGCKTGSVYRPEGPGYSIGGGYIPSETSYPFLSQFMFREEPHGQSGIIAANLSPEPESQVTQATTLNDLLLTQAPLKKDAGASPQSDRVTSEEEPEGEEHIDRPTFLLLDSDAYLTNLGLRSRYQNLDFGSVIARNYEILEKLGEGPIATVYLAKPNGSLIPNHRVVLKIVRPKIVSEVFKNQVSRSLSHWWEVSHHHHEAVLGLNTIKRIGGGQLLLEIENFDAVPLSNFLNKGTQVSPSEAVSIVRKVARALEFAHRHGLVHGFVKPSNILFDETELRVKVTDFCPSPDLLAYLLSQNALAPEAITYLPPEALAEGVHPDHSGDIWSLGVLLYQLLTGSSPFPATTYEEAFDAVRFADYEQPLNISPEIPFKLNQVLKRTLEKRPERRYQQVGKLLKELDVVERQMNDPARVLSLALVEHLDDESSDFMRERLTDLGYEGESLIDLALAYCNQHDPMEDIPKTWLNPAVMTAALKKRGVPDHKATPVHDLAGSFLNGLGVAAYEEPVGLKQSREKVYAYSHDIKQTTSREHITGLVTSATSELEFILRQLIRSHAILLFQESWYERLAEEVLGDMRRLISRPRGKTLELGVTVLLEILDRFNNYLSTSSTPESDFFSRMFQTRSILEVTGIWKQNISSLRNKFVHDQAHAQASFEQIRIEGVKLIVLILDVLSAIEEARTFPRALSIREVTRDVYGRQYARCDTDNNHPLKIYTSADIRPGEQYFMFTRNTSICVEPFLIPASW